MKFGHCFAIFVRLCGERSKFYYGVDGKKNIVIESECMKDYELTLISQTNLPEEAFQGLLQGLSSWIQGKEGILEKQDTKRNVPLLAPIQKHAVGNMAVLRFKMNEEAILELEKRVKEEKPLLRAMLTKFRRQKAAKIPTFRKQVQTAPAQEPKLSPEEIDKELEQIFQEKKA